MEHHYQYKTAFYREGRPGYSDKAAQLVAGVAAAPHAVIADMGSGTGIFSASLLEKGCAVYCVEPGGAFREKAEKRLRRFNRFTSVAAPAEDTRLPDHCVDGVVAASSFHWFDPELFRRECDRILKPGGSVFLIYNIRQTNDPFSGEQEVICRRHCPGFISLRHGADKARERCPAFFSGGFEEKRYRHDLLYSREQFLSRCLSSSYSPDRTQPGYSAYLQELERLIAAHCADDRIAISNQTVVWYGTI